MLEIEHFPFAEKVGTEDYGRPVLTFLGNLESRINVVQKSWNGNPWKSLAWDQYLSQNMKLKFGIGYGISIFSKTWNGHLLIWNQYLSTTWMDMWWYRIDIFLKTGIRFLNLGHSESWQLYTLKCRNENQDTKKPRNQVFLFSTEGIILASTYRLPPLHQPLSWGTWTTARPPARPPGGRVALINQLCFRNQPNNYFIEWAHIHYYLISLWINYFNHCSIYNCKGWSSHELTNQFTIHGYALPFNLHLMSDSHCNLVDFLLCQL